MADAMEVALLSFISICAGEDWDLSNAQVTDPSPRLTDQCLTSRRMTPDLSDQQVASITGAVFGGQILGSIYV